MQSRAVTLATVGAFAVFLACMAALGVVEEDLYGGWHWQAFTFVALESTLTVFGPVWLLGTAQRRLDRRLPWGAASSRYAYGAFILQGLVLIGLAVTLRPSPLPAELKALIVAAGGVAGSFALAGLLINRVPGMARIL